MTEQETIYVFDFDDTLIFSNNSIYIFEIHHETKEEFLAHTLTATEFFEFEVKDNHRIDYSEFDTLETGKKDYSTIKLNHPVVRIFKDAIEQFGSHSVHICSARSNTEPIQDIIESLLGHSNISIAAVGHPTTTINSTPLNALRKRDHIKQLIKEKKPKTLYFYDDSSHNLEAVHSLRSDEEVASITSVRCIEVLKENLKMLPVEDI